MHKVSVSRKARRNKRKSLGLCVMCGFLPPVSGILCCIVCKEKERKASARRRKNRVSRKECTNCGNVHNRGKNLCDDCNEKQRVRQREVRKRNKTFLFNYFERKCNHCNESEIIVMTIDHVNNDGYKDRNLPHRSSLVATPQLYAKYVKDIKAGVFDRSRFQMLCFNCHAKKDNKPEWY